MEPSGPVKTINRIALPLSLHFHDTWLALVVTIFIVCHIGLLNQKKKRRYEKIIHVYLVLAVSQCTFIGIVWVYPVVY
jgi:hypothetical protein